MIERPVATEVEKDIAAKLKERPKIKAKRCRCQQRNYENLFKWWKEKETGD